MALFMIFYKAKHTQLGGQRTDMPNYIYRLIILRDNAALQVVITSPHCLHGSDQLSPW